MAAGSLPRLSLRIGIVQFSPKVSALQLPGVEANSSQCVLQIGQVQANLRRARELTCNIRPSSLDLLCFPEMAFTGYNFEGPSEIEHHLEKPRSGPTSVFCSELAKQLHCYVVAGYPERLQQEELEECIRHDQVIMDDSDKPSDDSPAVRNRVRRIVGANSAVLYGADGEWMGGYRKSNLFRTDKTWAAAGSGFATFNLPPPLQTVTLAICMDLNPFPGTTWTLEDGPYELADYCISSHTNLLILLNAWLDPGEETDDEHSWSTLQYWAARLRPLWCRERDPSSGEPGTAASGPTNSGEGTLVAVCNRTGEENGTKYVGCSALFKMERNLGRPKLVDMMTREEEGIRIWHIQT